MSSPDSIRQPTKRLALEMRKISKSFGPTEVLRRVDFELRPGEIHALVGENGAGKTTTLRIIQSYALFPHMTVAGNVGYGLRMRRVPAPESKRRVAEALELVRLTGYADRYPSQLSGGQQQRAALAPCHRHSPFGAAVG